MTTASHFSLLVVDDESGKPVGILSTLDMARVLAERSLR